MTDDPPNLEAAEVEPMLDELEWRIGAMTAFELRKVVALGERAVELLRREATPAPQAPA